MIEEFKGQYRFLSNFYVCTVVYEGRVYTSSEHAYQAAKTLAETEKDWIASLETPSLAKKAGRKVALRIDWNEKKLGVMKEVVRAKFTEPDNKLLKIMLLQTGDEELIEGNNWGDTYWGMVGGYGENHLGKILMELREELMKELAEIR